MTELALCSFRGEYGDVYYWDEWKLIQVEEGEIRCVMQRQL